MDLQIMHVMMLMDLYDYFDVSSTSKKKKTKSLLKSVEEEGAHNIFLYKYYKGLIDKIVS